MLARAMLAPVKAPRVVTTLHGTDTTLLGCDPGYGPAIHHALTHSDAVTAVSHFLKQETERVLGFTGPIDVIHNFFEPQKPRLSREDVRCELGVRDETLLLHSSNLRPPKRIDLLLEIAAKIRPRNTFKLLILAGGSFAPFVADVRRLGLQDRLIVRENVTDIEDYLQASDLGLFTSESESFCLSILEAMSFARPSVAPSVGGIPEVMEDQVSGWLVPFGDIEQHARAVEHLIRHPEERARLGQAAQKRAREMFCANAIVPRYEELYRRVLGG
jgi:N-acetyl-alpha-D-glucosaminyl L-malate synthase BshA